jgi:RNA polymerase sigma-70 factor (ECF subfamily)
MTHNGEALAPRLESFRGYLMLLAEAQLDPRLRAKIDPADLVQQTLLRAYERRALFRGDDDAHRAGWLRTILARVLVDAVRKFARAEGGPRERSLEAALDRSSARLEALLAADQTSPSGRAQHDEQLVRLADALSALPEDQRRAIELRHLQGLTVAETGQVMGRSIDAVTGLLHRGLKGLRRGLGTD